MASINDRWWNRTVDGAKCRSDRYGTGLRWQVRYRNPEGASRNKSFERRADAERFLASISVDLHRGAYIDPQAGQICFEELAARWLASRTADSNTIVQNELQIRRHMNPYWGSRSVGSIKPSEIQAWIAKLQESGCSPRYVRLIFTNFRMILNDAVDDALLARNPSTHGKLRLPPLSNARIEVWTREQVSAVVAAHPQHLQLLPLLGATCGLRQGEALGIRIQDVDFDNLEINVRQQIKLVNTRPSPALPKFQKTRVVPVPEFVAALILKHLETVEVLDGDQSLEPGVGGLLFYFRERKPINKNYYNTHVWKQALLASGITPRRSNGTHALRHFCASTWLEHGVSIRAVAEYLGHADPGFTLRVYTHLMPKSDEQARSAFENLESHGS